MHRTTVAGLLVLATSLAQGALRAQTSAEQQQVAVDQKLTRDLDKTARDAIAVLANPGPDPSCLDRPWHSQLT